MLQCPTFKREADAPEVPEPFAAEAKFFTESRLLQRDVQIVLESCHNQNILGTILHPASGGGEGRDGGCRDALRPLLEMLELAARSCCLHGARSSAAGLGAVLSARGCRRARVRLSRVLWSSGVASFDSPRGAVGQALHRLWALGTRGSEGAAQDA